LKDPNACLGWVKGSEQETGFKSPRIAAFDDLPRIGGAVPATRPLWSQKHVRRDIRSLTVVSPSPGREGQIHPQVKTSQASQLPSLSLPNSIQWFHEPGRLPTVSLIHSRTTSKIRDYSRYSFLFLCPAFYHHVYGKPESLVWKASGNE
jgi:hypothetical protein